jgi:hypothetical protein
MPSRAHAETIFLLAQRSIHGPAALPKSEKETRALQTKVAARLAFLAAKASELSRSRTGDEKKAMELARLLEFWMTRGKG